MFLTYKIVFKTFKTSKVKLILYKSGDKIHSKPGSTFHLSSKQILRFKPNWFHLCVGRKGTRLGHRYMYNKTSMAQILKNKTSFILKEKEIAEGVWLGNKMFLALST